MHSGLCVNGKFPFLLEKPFLIIQRSSQWVFWDNSKYPFISKPLTAVAY